MASFLIHAPELQGKKTCEVVVLEGSHAEVMSGLGLASEIPLDAQQFLCRQSLSALG